MGSHSAAANHDSATEMDPTIGSDTETNGDDLAPRGLSQFEEGDKVLAEHYDRFYEAKVLKVAYDVNEWKYLVHYIGWKKTWDEWIGMDRLKHTEENIETQLEQLDMKQGGKSARASKVTSPNVTRGRKRKPDSIDVEENIVPSNKDSTDTEENVVQSNKDSIDVEENVVPSNNDSTDIEENVVPSNKDSTDIEENVVPSNNDSTDIEENVVPSNNILSFKIPPSLRKQLLDDFEYVSRKKLVQLPRDPNVVDILKTYVDSKNGTVSDSVEEILKGLRCYFDKALPVKLLYNNERKQYEESGVSADVSPSTVYGAEHLLRLFVKLPELITHVNMAEETLKQLQDSFVDVLRFLKKNQSLLFVSAYQAVEEGMEVEQA